MRRRCSSAWQRSLGSALCIAACACGGGDGTLPAGPEDPDTTNGSDTTQVVDSIMMKPAYLYIDSLGVQRQTAARALTDDSSYLYSSVDHPDRFVWSSSDPDILSVNGDGVATSEGWGVATLTAEHEDGLAGTMRVVVQEAVRPAWSVRVGPGTISGDVAVGPDGTIYVGTNHAPSYRSTWYAVSSEGDVHWTLELPIVRRSPAIAEDGTLYFGAESRAESGSGVSGFPGTLIAVDPGGAVRWTLPTGEGVDSSPAVGPEGTVYVATGYHVHAVDPRGEIRWTFEAEDDVFFLSSPAVASDGTIYVGAEDGLLYALDPDGSLRWAFETEDRIRSSPAIAADGTIYFGSNDGKLYAVRPDGTERWSREMRCGLPWGCLHVGSSPAIGPDGTIYVSVGALYALDPEDGSVLWGSDPIGNETTAVVGADGTVYFGSPRGITALDAEGRIVWHYPGVGYTDAIHGAPAIGGDGKIYSTSFSGSNAEGYEGTVHAYVEDDPRNGGYAGASWPTGRGDRANTGRAGG